MTNDLTAFTPEYWSRRTQILLRKMLVGRKIASFEERPTLRNGDVVHRPYHNDPYVVDYTKGTDITIQDIDTTDEYLTVNQSKVVPVYVDEVDRIQNKYDTANKLIDRSAHMLGRDIDSAVLAQVTNAVLDIDAGDVGGSAGSPITLSTSNAVNTFSSAYAELASNNVESDKSWFLVVDPKMANIITQTYISSGFQTADLSLRNGFLGDWLGFQLYQSNSLKSSASVGIATNPTANDTVSINGVTFKFVASPSAAGDVDIGANAAGSVDNLVAAINGGTGAGTAYIALSQADRAKLKNNQVVATDNTTSIAVTAAGRMILAETFTDGTDAWGTQTVYSIAGKTGSIDLVVQSEPKLHIKDEPKKLGKNYFSHTLYGVKTFNEGTERICEINIAA